VGVPTSLVILIGAANELSDLRPQFDESEVLTFADQDVLHALEMIMVRRPSLVALERAFAGTPRGTALINRLRADPSLSSIEIQTVSSDGERLPATPLRGSVGLTEPSVQPLDNTGTRRASRVRLRDGLDALLEGHSVRLVDLSTYGAQITSTGVLKPNQRVRLSLVDEKGSIRCVAVVVWAAFELPRAPRTRPHYRVGLAFLDAHPDAVDAYAARNARQD
jgi:hypothetical protein